MKGCLDGLGRADSPPHPALKRAPTSPREAVRGESGASANRKKAGIAPGLPFFVDSRVKSGHDEIAQFNEARFGGVAGHDLISAS
jgi:hypothetical protein